MRQSFAGGTVKGGVQVGCLIRQDVDGLVQVSVGGGLGEAERLAVQG